MVRAKDDMNTEMKEKLSEIYNPVSAMSTMLSPATLRMPRLPELDIPDSVINPAKWMYTRLVEYIKTFEENLDNDHEIGARLVSFGQTITFHIEDIGYYGPDIITFDGIDEHGQVLKLIQHTSQLSVLLMAIKNQTEKPRRIGFKLEDKATS